MAHAIATGRCSSTYTTEPSAMQTQTVAHVIQSDCAGKVCIKHGNHMAPRGKCARLCLMLSRQPGNQVRRNKLANLLQTGILTTYRYCGLFHGYPLLLVWLVILDCNPALFQDLNEHSYGMTVKKPDLLTIG